MTRRVALVLGAVLLAAGCGKGSPPEVAFGAGAATVTARPAQYCDLQLTACDADATAPVELAVPAGTPLRVEVPSAISGTPWHVVFSYRSATGELVDGRSPVFGADVRSDYTLELPTPGDKLLTVQVQQFGPPPQANGQTGETEFPVRGSWVLAVSG